jgi:hypothetical protein
MFVFLSPATYSESILFFTCLLDTHDSCLKKKFNREKVQYQQCTCSQSYIIAKAYILVRK